MNNITKYIEQRANRLGHLASIRWKDNGQALINRMNKNAYAMEKGRHGSDKTAQFIASYVVQRVRELYPDVSLRAYGPALGYDQKGAKTTNKSKWA